MTYEQRHKLYKQKRLHGLPLFFPCGVVDRTTKPITIQEPSNLVCMDIDRKDNLFANFPWLTTMCEKARANPKGWGVVSEETARLFNSTCLICVSTSGTGVFMLMHFKGDRDRAFDYAVATLAKVGINADMGAKAAAQFRYFSYDPKAYVNYDPVTLEVPDDWRPTTKATTTTTATPSAEIEVPPQEIPKFKASTMKVQKQLEKALQYVVATHTDITRTIDDWKKLKTSIRSAENEKVVTNGLSIFWAFARYWNDGKADAQANKDFYLTPLTRVCKHDYPPSTLSGLWSLCRKYGVPYE